MVDTTLPCLIVCAKFYAESPAGRYLYRLVLTQINRNFLKVLDYVQYPLEGCKYLNEIIFCHKNMNIISKVLKTNMPD